MNESELAMLKKLLLKLKPEVSDDYDLINAIDEVINYASGG